MTSVLNLNSSSTTNPPQSLTTNDTSLLSNPKTQTTFIIQPPLSTKLQPQTLLHKRYNPAELGDLLLKKIKTQTANSENNSNQHSPTLKENHNDNGSNCLESTSVIEEISSPSIRSFTEETEKLNPQRILEGVLIPQRSISTPLIFNTFNLRHPKAGTDPHKQVQHALEVLQKKLMMEQQAAALRELLLKIQTSQEPLVIPPLLSSSNSTQRSVIDEKGRGKRSMKELEDENDVFYGAVEYPLLSMAPPLFGGENTQKDGNTINLPSSSATLNNVKTSTKRPGKVEFDSLSATRADTQKSESDACSSYIEEELSQGSEGRRVRRPKNGKKEENTAKGKKGEKTKVRRQKNDGLLSPVKTGKRLTERRKNKWQTGENAQIEGAKKVENNNDVKTNVELA